MKLDDIGGEFGRLVEGVLQETGKSLGDGLQAVRAYAAERTLHLSQIVGQPGFYEAVKVERDNVLLKAGIVAVGVGDAADLRLVGIVEGFLALGARILVAA